eukprot:689302-Amphidinium_carterae.2
MQWYNFRAIDRSALRKDAGEQPGSVGKTLPHQAWSLPYLIDAIPSLAFQEKLCNWLTSLRQAVPVSPFSFSLVPYKLYYCEGIGAAARQATSVVTRLAIPVLTVRSAMPVNPSVRRADLWATPFKTIRDALTRQLQVSAVSNFCRA